MSNSNVIIKSTLFDNVAARGRALDPNATLDRVAVLFVLPDGDDRDSDTGISVFLKKQNGTAAAGDPNVAPGQHFKDPGTYGPYNLPVQTAMTVAEFKGGFCEVVISPNGHDHWVFNAVLLSHFTDGTIVHSDSDTVGLDQDHRTFRFGL